MADESESKALEILKDVRSGVTRVEDKLSRIDRQMVKLNHAVHGVQRHEISQDIAINELRQRNVNVERQVEALIRYKEGEADR